MTSIPRREQVAMSALGGQYRGPVLELDDASAERGLELATRIERHGLPDAPSAPAQHRGARDLELRKQVRLPRAEALLLTSVRLGDRKRSGDNLSEVARGVVTFIQSVRHDRP